MYTHVFHIYNMYIYKACNPRRYKKAQKYISCPKTARPSDLSISPRHGFAGPSVQGKRAVPPPEKSKP